MDEARHATLVSAEGKNLMLLGVTANGAVKGRLLVMTLQQRYRNTSNNNTEITYNFPLPHDAVLMDVEVVLNGKALTGEVIARSTARAKYEEAISEGNSSIMLEKNHDGSYTLELGNLMAREECQIMVRYAQVLPTEHGQVRLVLPTTIAPRYGDPITQGKLLPHQVPVTDLTAEYPFDIKLTLMGKLANADVGSPSHKTHYSRNDDKLIVTLSQRGCLDRDFILVISKLKNESDGLACQDLYEEGQFALMAFFSPKIESTGPKAMTAKILVDCSGSMNGDSIDAARRALVGIVSGLTKEDKFCLSRFGDTVEHRSSGMWSGTKQTKASAMRWIENVRADLGGTEMAKALVSTIAIADKAKSDILLITDGEIEDIQGVITVAKMSKHRVFIVAIGASPAEVHLRRLATKTGGHCDFVAPGEAVEPAVLRMSARMRAARATHLRVEWPASMSLRWVQKIQNYAFEDDTFTVCAFVNAPADDAEITTAKLWGRIDGQADEVLMGQAELMPTQSSTNILARLTAYARYMELARAPKTVSSLQMATTEQQLAVKYKLVTDQTNFILVHERSEAEWALEMPDGHKVPQMLAAGWGGIGSVMSARPMASANIFHSKSAPDHASMATPTLWRTRSLSSAASKVDALNNGGMDDFEIPAFLRRQDSDSLPAVSRLVRQGIDKLNPLYWFSNDNTGKRTTPNVKDFGYQGITPAGVERWLNINRESLWPTSYADLRELGLDLGICEWLEFAVGEGREEALVVMTFLRVMLEFGLSGSSGLRGAVQALKRTAKVATVVEGQDELAAEIRGGLMGVTATVWPNAVIDFPAEYSSALIPSVAA